MNKSKKFLERYSQYQEDKAELEEIRKFEEELYKEYGPCVARGKEEVDKFFAELKKERLQSATR